VTKIEDIAMAVAFWPNGRTLSAHISCPRGASKGNRSNGATVSMKRASGAPCARRVRVAFVRPLVALATTAAFVGLLACARPAFAQGEGAELSPEIGYNYNEIETARVAGTGGAVRAFSNSIHALFVNPANLAAARVYHIGALAQIWPEAGRQSYGAAAVDSVVSNAQVAGGVGGTFNLQDLDGIARRWTDLRFALAYPISEQFLIGAGGRYLSLSQDGQGPLGRSLASSGLDNQIILKEVTFDGGVTLKPSPQLAISIVGNNLTAPNTSFQPVSVGGGVGVAFGDYSIEADVVGDFESWEKTTLRAMGGIEALFADHVSARVGYRYDEGAGSHALSGGIGYIDRIFDVDAAVRRVVSGETATAIVLGFTYHLDSTGITPSPGEAF
jgi:opacity protein-like surface antigen